jgi:N-terminal domain of anti-restriction factor ArdC
MLLMPTTTKTRKPSTSKVERRVWVDAKYTELAGLADSISPTDQARYEARFDRFSPGNAALIGAQMPNATLVHTFDDWKALGRHVRAGEHCRIFVYGYNGTYPAKASGTDQAPAADTTSPDGAITTKAWARYRLVREFDISQTEPDDDATDQS